MTTNTNDVLFIKTVPPKKAGHKQKPITTDNFALYRDSNDTNLYILNCIKFTVLKTAIQVDVIAMTPQKEPYGKTFLIMPKAQCNPQDIIKMLLMPTVSSQIKGYTFTYNMMDTVQNIAKHIPINVTVPNGTMDKGYLELHTATPKNYIIGRFGIIGYNNPDISGDMYSLELGNSVQATLHTQLLNAEPSRREMVRNRINGAMRQKGKIVNIHKLESDLLTSIKVSVFDTPYSIEEF